MKTSIDYVRVTEVDELNQPRSRTVQIKNEDGRLMVDRIIQIFSQHEKDQVHYDRALENEVYHDYHEQLARGLAITIALHDEQVTKEFYDAVYGVDRDAPNPYMTFAKSQVAASTDAISGNEDPSAETIELQKKIADIMANATDSNFALIGQTLRARRRIFKFNKRYREKVG